MLLFLFFLFSRLQYCKAQLQNFTNRPIVTFSDCQHNFSPKSSNQTDAQLRYIIPDFVKVQKSVRQINALICVLGQHIGQLTGLQLLLVFPTHYVQPKFSFIGKPIQALFTPKTTLIQFPKQNTQTWAFYVNKIPQIKKLGPIRVRPSFVQIYGIFAKITINTNQFCKGDLQLSYGFEFSSTYQKVCFRNQVF